MTSLPYWFTLGLLSCLAWAAPAAAAERTAFFYGRSVPEELLSAYDQVVVEPDHVASLEGFERRRARPIAYLSVGEVARSSRRFSEVDPSWILSENRAWSSAVMDLASPGYQAYLMRRFDELWASGYRGFFLDTLDSWRLAAEETRDEGLRRGLVDIIRGFAARKPEARLLLNRGFEVLEDVRGVVHGVVAESLFDRWDAATQSYRRVPEKDRRWLAGELTRVRDRLGLPVTVIDYRPPWEKPAARETARKIAALGFTPWVTNSALDDVGIGPLEILPRRVLIVTNDEAPGVPDAVRLLSPVLEYLGYVPEHRRAPRDWSELRLDRAHQGVITWFSSGALPPGFADWMHAGQRRGLRFVSFGVPGFDLEGRDARALGLSLMASSSAGPTRVAKRDALVGFEAEPPARPFDGPLVRLADTPGHHVHLALTDDRGRSGVAVATTPWGGLALSHVLALRGLSGERAWVIDPFAFLSRSLSLPDAPFPTVTTHNGRRLGLIVVRPEGLAAPAAHGHPASALALGEWLASRRRWPHSLATDPSTQPSAADLAAAQHLLELGFFERAELAPGTTLARGPGASLTSVSGLRPGGQLLGPIAFDALFLPGGEPQAYPYRGVLQTLLFTELPRRLKPVLLDYHGWLVQSPGGRRTLAQLYDWLDAQALYPAFVSEYAALAQAFAEQVVARGLDGSFHYFGGEALRTVRSPLSLGYPEAGGATLVVQRGPDGLYTSFAGQGPRRLRLGKTSIEGPHLRSTNGRVLAFEVESASEASAVVRLELDAHTPLGLELGGLPPRSRCELSHARAEARGEADAEGALQLQLETQQTGQARLSCLAPTPHG